MTLSVVNLLPSLSNKTAEENFPLLETEEFRLEHLASHGQASSPGFWYDQPEPEWVLLLRGTATLDFGDQGMLELRAGDSLTIPARMRHRVARVSRDAVWVALHYRSSLFDTAE